MFTLNSVMFVFLAASNPGKSFVRTAVLLRCPTSFCILSTSREADKHVSFHRCYQILPRNTPRFSPNTKHQTKRVLKNQLKTPLSLAGTLSRYSWEDTGKDSVQLLSDSSAKPAQDAAAFLNWLCSNSPGLQDLRMLRGFRGWDNCRSSATLSATRLLFIPSHHRPQEGGTERRAPCFNIEIFPFSFH